MRVIRRCRVTRHRLGKVCVCVCVCVLVCVCVGVRASVRVGGFSVGVQSTLLEVRAEVLLNHLYEKDRAFCLA